MSPHRALSTALLTALSLTAASAVPATASAATDPWVRPWGANAAGQLGNGTTIAQPTPGSILNVARTDLRKLAAGAQTNGFVIALLTDGTVKSWGSNTEGQLGNGTTTAQPVPTSVAGLSGVSAIGAGTNHALAVRKGRVHAWGSNAKGQLGNGVTDEKNPATTPVQVQSLDDVKDVGAGCEFSTALRNDGTVWTWGQGANGRLGSGDTADLNTPQQVEGLTDIDAISVGCAHVLALTVDGTVKAWGAGSNGQLGNNAKNDSAKPVDVRLLDKVTSVSAAAYHNFAILEDGTVKGWGWNDHGQLGDGTITDRTTPVPIDSLKGTRSISGGRDHTLAAQPDGSVLTLGNNDTYQLGNGTTTPTMASNKPVTALPPGSGITRVASAVNGRSAFAY
ncbi:RCC1 domain-containing protein [Streptomyces anulatus]|uniref:RCC1 domain-containing protein n=1 Tax=Streptomyces anulatus TaxID=1892 RepID=UPI0036D86664